MNTIGLQALTRAASKNFAKEESKACNCDCVWRQSSLDHVQEVFQGFKTIGLRLKLTFPKPLIWQQIEDIWKRAENQEYTPAASKVDSKDAWKEIRGSLEEWVNALSSEAFACIFPNNSFFNDCQKLSAKKIKHIKNRVKRHFPNTQERDAVKSIWRSIQYLEKIDVQNVQALVETRQAVETQLRTFLAGLNEIDSRAVRCNVINSRNPCAIDLYRINTYERELPKLLLRDRGEWRDSDLQDLFASLLRHGRFITAGRMLEQIQDSCLIEGLKGQLVQEIIDAGNVEEMAKCMPWMQMSILQEYVGFLLKCGMDQQAKDILAKYPSLALIIDYRAVCALFSNDASEAIFRGDVNNQNPEDLEAASRISLVKKQYDHALHLLQKIEDPNTRDSAIGELAQTLISGGQWEMALNPLEAITRDDIRDCYYSRIADGLMISKQLDLALTLLQRIRTPSTRETALHVGIQRLLNIGNTSAAYKWLNAIPSHSQRYSQGARYYALSTAYMDLEAAYAMAKSIQDTEIKAETLSVLLQWYLHSKDLTGAKKILADLSGTPFCEPAKKIVGTAEKYFMELHLAPTHL